MTAIQCNQFSCTAKLLTKLKNDFEHRYRLFFDFQANFLFNLLYIYDRMMY